MTRTQKRQYVLNDFHGYFRSPIHHDLRTPKYKPRVTPNTKRKLSKRACRDNPRR